MDLRPKHSRRKAISPVLATVILIAITLIAAIAVAGFVFGLFGSFTSSAAVSEISSNFAAAGTGSALAQPASAPFCQATAPSSGYYLEFSNTGTANTAINSVSLSYGGNTASVSISNPSANCIAKAGAQEYVLFTALEVGGAAAATGQRYTGSASLGNGGSVSYTGTFQ